MKDGLAPLPPGSRKAQNLEGYEELSVEDLDKIMLTGKDPVAEKRAEEKEEDDDDLMDPNPDDVKDTVDEPDEEEAEGDEEAEADDKIEEADQVKAKPDSDEDSPLANRIRLLERRLELEALERTKESEARKRAELLASKQAGRAGYLQQQLSKSPPKAQPKAEAEGDEDPWADEEKVAKESRSEQNRPTSEVPQQWEEDRAELVRIAINDEGNDFANMHASDLEEMPKEFLTRLQALMKEEAAPYADEFLSSSMKTVRKLARSLMNSAYATARIEFADKVAENAKAEATTRKAESVGKSKRRKAKAAISGGGAKAKSQPKPKSYEDMTNEELEVEMQKEYGDNYRLGSDASKHGGL